MQKYYVVYLYSDVYKIVSTGIKYYYIKST